MVYPYFKRALHFFVAPPDVKQYFLSIAFHTNSFYSNFKTIPESIMKKTAGQIILPTISASCSRRTLLAAGIGSLTAMMTTSHRVLAQPVFQNYPFSLGIASEEPSADRLVLWTRVAPAPYEQM